MCLVGQFPLVLFNGNPELAFAIRYLISRHLVSQVKHCYTKT